MSIRDWFKPYADEPEAKVIVVCTQCLQKDAEIHRLLQEMAHLRTENGKLALKVPVAWLPMTTAPNSFPDLSAVKPGQYVPLPPKPAVGAVSRVERMMKQPSGQSDLIPQPQRKKRSLAGKRKSR